MNLSEEVNKNEIVYVKPVDILINPLDNHGMWFLFSNIHILEDHFKNEVTFLKNIDMSELVENFYVWYPELGSHMETKLVNSMSTFAGNPVTCFINMGLDDCTRKQTMDGLASWGRRLNGKISRDKIYEVLFFIVFCTQSLAITDFKDEEDWDTFYENGYDILSLI
jgi:hypothetical protein